MIQGSMEKEFFTNSLFVAEALSPSTEADDRGSKWRSCQTIPTLQRYVWVSANEPRVEVFTRTGDGGGRVMRIA